MQTQQRMRRATPQLPHVITKIEPQQPHINTSKETDGCSCRSFEASSNIYPAVLPTLVLPLMNQQSLLMKHLSSTLMLLLQQSHRKLLFFVWLSSSLLFVLIAVVFVNSWPIEVVRFYVKSPRSYGTKNHNN